MVAEADLHRHAREARLARGLTQRQVAELLDVSQPTIAQAESDAGRSLTALRLRILSTLQGASIDGPFWLIHHAQTP